MPIFHRHGSVRTFANVTDRIIVTIGQTSGCAEDVEYPAISAINEENKPSREGRLPWWFSGGVNGHRTKILAQGKTPWFRSVIQSLTVASTAVITLKTAGNLLLTFGSKPVAFSRNKWQNDRNVTRRMGIVYSDPLFLLFGPQRNGHVSRDCPLTSVA